MLIEFSDILLEMFILVIPSLTAVITAESPLPATVAIEVSSTCQVVKEAISEALIFTPVTERFAVSPTEEITTAFFVVVRYFDETTPNSSPSGKTVILKTQSSQPERLAVTVAVPLPVPVTVAFK